MHIQNKDEEISTFYLQDKIDKIREISEWGQKAMKKQEFVYIEEQHFKKSGQTIKFSGMCIGSWLNIEHFMFGMPGPEQVICHTIEKAFGKQVKDKFIMEFRKDFLDEKDFIFMKNCGINLLRVPFNYRLFIDDEYPDRLKEEGFFWFDRILDFCRKYGIYLMPDLHSVPGGQNPDWHSDNYTGVPQFWQYQIFRKQIVSLWGKIAAYYKDEPMILGYDILNEPYLMGVADVLDEFYKAVTEEIRKEDKNHIIFLEGDHFAMDFRRIKNLTDDNTAITFHFYPTVWEPELLTDKYSRSERKLRFEIILKEIIQVRERLQVPVLCGELGYDISPANIGKAMELLEDTIELLMKEEISWTVWTYKDAQALGCCYPRKESSWSKFTDRIHQYWTHYKEMDQAKELVEDICKIPEFARADEWIKYCMQFRVRGILYQFQSEYILLPELKKFEQSKFLQLPMDWRFENCTIYKEYESLLKKMSYCLE